MSWHTRAIMSPCVFLKSVSQAQWAALLHRVGLLGIMGRRSRPTCSCAKALNTEKLKSEGRLAPVRVSWFHGSRAIRDPLRPETTSFRSQSLLPRSREMPAQKVETGHQDTVHDVVMDYYGKRVATASSDNTIKIIGVSNSSSQHLATLTGHQGPVWQVAWAHPKFGSLLASCSYDGRVILWKEGNQNEWTQAHVFDDHKSSVNSIAWAPHELGLCLACGSSDGNISVFTARSDGGWDTSRIDQAHPIGVTSVSWAPSTAPGALVGSGLLDPVQKLCSGGCDNTVKVWKLGNGIWKLDCFPALHMHVDWVRDVAWAPNLGLPKSTIASASQDGKVIIWTVGKDGDQWEGKVLHDFNAPVWRVSWSLTGNILAVADGNNSVTLWKEAVDGEWQQVTTVDP
ncbi:protein transport protein SEC13 homolog B-like [Pyrus x bretschneideri]|uniref:protein transport protein SEC13 homolog B-like n=1 Tax=Pyrus x bretschneideri TaxID=225117 RepID=UPI00202DF336|nr:protein transport protein SEC13 homolog B-like [Pyrus x bretschneideri]